MAFFSKSSHRGTFMDEIRCDEPFYLIWKWHPAGSLPGNKRENAIRCGSSLRVKEGEVAVFVYSQANGTMQDFIVGPFDQTIQTANLPVLSSMIGLLFDGGTPFQAEVYFINLARILQVKFGVPFFDVYDPRFEDFGVPVAVRGTISFRIEDYRGFVKLHRLNSFSLEAFQREIRDAVTRYVKDTIANAPAAHNIPLVQIESKTAQINDTIEHDIKERLQDSFGVVVSSVDISAIELDKSSEGYRQLMGVTRDLAGATAKAETEAHIRDIAEKQRIEAEHYEETLRIQREEAQYAQRKQTQTSYMGAFQVEKQAEVGIAGAEALEKMDSTGGTAFHPAAMAAEMAIGNAVGQSIAGATNAIMSAQAGTTPPPIPVSTYHVAVNGQATGPYDRNTLTQMAATGALSADSLVWKAGMPDWVRAGTVDELKGLFVNAIPPIPPTA